MSYTIEIFNNRKVEIMAFIYYILWNICTFLSKTIIVVNILLVQWENLEIQEKRRLCFKFPEQMIRYYRGFPNLGSMDPSGVHKSAAD